jgi:hypothetical protein
LNGPLVPVSVTNRDQRFSSRSTCLEPRGGLVPVRKQPGLKAGAFSPALLVPVATTGTNGLYKPGLKAFFPPVGVGVMVLSQVFSFSSPESRSTRQESPPPHPARLESSAKEEVERSSSIANASLSIHVA